MTSWAGFAADTPSFASFVRVRLHGRTSYLATTRRDGSPRVHPVTPIVSDTTLYMFMEPTSPKGKDLERDPRYALHAGVENNQGGEGEVLVTGTAARVTDPVSRDEAIASATYAPEDRYILFALDVAEVLVTTYLDGQPERRRWPSRS